MINYNTLTRNLKRGIVKFTEKISNITLTDIQCVSENKAVIDGNISELKISDCSIVVNETELRKYAIKYDIAPNGYLEEENDFKGRVFDS